MTTKEVFVVPHFAERLLERYGMLVTPALYQEMLNQVTGHLAEKLFDQSNGRTVYRVEIDGENIFVVYCAHGNVLLTVLHKGWVQFRNGQWEEKFRSLAKKRNNRNRRFNEYLKLNGMRKRRDSYEEE